jgi:hypothetical protein
MANIFMVRFRNVKHIGRGMTEMEASSHLFLEFCAMNSERMLPHSHAAHISQDLIIAPLIPTLISHMPSHKLIPLPF